MNNPARHEAAHAVAIHLLGLADVLLPGGAAVKADGGGLVALNCASVPDMAAVAARMDCRDNSPCGPAIEAALSHPDRVPALLCFVLAGYAATSENWAGDFGRTIVVRTSSDFNTAREILAGLLGGSGLFIDTFVSEQAREAIDRAVEWTRQRHVRTLIDAVARHLEAHGAATWPEIESIFSTTIDQATRETVSGLMAGPVCGLESCTPGAVEDGRPSFAAESLARYETINNDD